MKSTQIHAMIDLFQRYFFKIRKSHTRLKQLHTMTLTDRGFIMPYTAPLTKHDTAVTTSCCYKMDTNSSTTLSDLLCADYVYRHNSNPSAPLETFKLFKSSLSDDDVNNESWFISDQQEKHWIHFDVYKKGEIRKHLRVNSDSLRVSVIEVNMIRQSKISRPLKIRDYLPPRHDLFYSNIKSPLGVE